MRALASTTTKTATVSAGLKWGAVLTGLGLLAALYLFTAIITGHYRPLEVVKGYDGFPSTSKFQGFLWLIVILFSYTTLWTLRAGQHNYSGRQIPASVLIVLGFSTITAAMAKGITSGYVQSGRLFKVGRAYVASGQGGILKDDRGVPDLAKIQLVGFTFIAVGIYLITVIHQIVANGITAGLPNIDSSLIVLMVVSQGSYIGKKLATFDMPTLYRASPPSGPPGTAVTLSGANLESPFDSQLVLNGSPINSTSWSNTSIRFTVPAADPGGNAWTVPKQVVQLALSIMDQKSNSVPFTVTGYRPISIFGLRIQNKRQKP